MNNERRRLLGVCGALVGLGSGCAELPPERVPAGSLVVWNKDKLPHEATVTITSERQGRVRYGSISIRPGAERVFREVVTMEGSYTFVVSNEDGDEKRVPFEYPSAEYVEVSFTENAEMILSLVTVEA